MTDLPWPLTVVRSRYGGVYEQLTGVGEFWSGGRDVAWLAFNLPPAAVPTQVHGDDETCADWFANHSFAFTFGRGSTADAAVAELAALLHDPAAVEAHRANVAAIFAERAEPHITIRRDARGYVAVLSLAERCAPSRADAIDLVRMIPDTVRYVHVDATRVVHSTQSFIDGLVVAVLETRQFETMIVSWPPAPDQQTRSFFDTSTQRRGLDDRVFHTKAPAC